MDPVLALCARATAAATIALMAAPAASAAAPRALVDRPDEVAGSQVHVMYVVPSDGEDRALDTGGILQGSVGSFQAWLAAQTGGRRALRLDTFAGDLDVTFVRLMRSDAAIAGSGPFVRDQVQSELRARGFDHPSKLYAVYYDGASTFACGGGAWPPTLPGTVAAMYLRGAYGGVDCSRNPFATAGGAPGYMEWAMLHEILHTLGFVATCAPNHTRAGHTSTPANDLMYAGDAPWQFPPVLDPGRDDYYGHGRSGCLDLATSAFLGAWPPSAVQPTPPADCRVPRLIGLTRARSVIALRRAGCRVGRITTVRSAAPKGTVVRQSVRAGRTVPATTRISFVLSRGR